MADSRDLSFWNTPREVQELIEDNLTAAEHQRLYLTVKHGNFWLEEKFLNSASIEIYRKRLQETATNPANPKSPNPNKSSPMKRQLDKQNRLAETCQLRMQDIVELACSKRPQNEIYRDYLTNLLTHRSYYIEGRLYIINQLMSSPHSDNLQNSYHLFVGKPFMPAQKILSYSRSHDAIESTKIALCEDLYKLFVLVFEKPQQMVKHYYVHNRINNKIDENTSYILPKNRREQFCELVNLITENKLNTVEHIQEYLAKSTFQSDKSFNDSIIKLLQSIVNVPNLILYLHHITLQLKHCIEKNEIFVSPPAKRRLAF